MRPTSSSIDEHRDGLRMKIDFNADSGVHL
jgi:hypothetical protein